MSLATFKEAALLASPIAFAARPDSFFASADLDIRESSHGILLARLSASSASSVAFSGSRPLISSPFRRVFFSDDFAATTFDASVLEDAATNAFCASHGPSGGVVRPVSVDSDLGIPKRKPRNHPTALLLATHNRPARLSG